MARAARPLPILTRDELAWLRHLPKAVPDNWKDRLRSMASGAVNSSGTLYPTTPPDEVPPRSLYIYARENRDWPENFSCGLVYEDSDANKYHLVRLNNHGGHVNHLPGGRRHRLPVTPHIHYVTEFALTAKVTDPSIPADGWAVATTRFGTLDGALNALAELANLTYAPQLRRKRELP